MEIDRSSESPIDSRVRWDRRCEGRDVLCLELVANLKGNADPNGELPLEADREETLESGVHRSRVAFRETCRLADKVCIREGDRETGGDAIIAFSRLSMYVLTRPKVAGGSPDSSDMDTRIAHLAIMHSSRETPCVA